MGSGDFFFRTLSTGIIFLEFSLDFMGFAVWIDTGNELAWAQGTHEYRPMGTAVIGQRDQFRQRDFRQGRRRPAHLDGAFVGFFGSLEDLNARLRSDLRWKLRGTPGHLR